MSRRQDRLNYTATPFELDYGGRIQTGLILGAYEQEMKEHCKPEILLWHNIILSNFLDYWLPQHGYVICRRSDVATDKKP